MTIITQQRTWIEISRSAFAHNIAAYVRHVGNAVAIGVVVKSNGYGHGLAQMGQLCQENDHVAWLCTAMLSEALALRAQGVTKPIIVLSFIDADPRLAIEHAVDLVVYDMATLHMLDACGQEYGSPVAVHLKIDTGMSRFGFLPEEALEMAQLAADASGINLRGLCTHFADSANVDHTFTRSQSERFDAVVTALKTRGIAIPVIHASNSAGAVVPGISLGTMVRIGAGAYGLLPPSLAPDSKTPLKPIMHWKTKIAHIRTIPAHTTIGYGRLFSPTRDTIMGLISIGYADGYNAGCIAPAYNGIVCVREQSVPVIGRLCMNVVMIDVTDCAAATVGDEVLLLGDYPEMTPYAHAVRTGSSNGRVISSYINPEIKRVIVS